MNKKISHFFNEQQRHSFEKVAPKLSQYPTKLQQIYYARGIQDTDQLDYQLKYLLPPQKLLNLDLACAEIFDAIKQNKKILIIGDFDVDGATSSALLMKALTQMGASQVDFMVPDRFKFGYGLSVKLVQQAAQLKPDLIITVDNGIANHQGVEEANRFNIPVIITDHHLPAETLPNAKVIVNPNQAGDSFPSKNLAGVGVAFYLMLGLRQTMRDADWFKQLGIKQPNLADLLDLVALGTVADVVLLDNNNRILVEQGLKRIRSGRACAGINALLKVAKRDVFKCQSSDLGFTLGPRLNAAGRLDDMSVGIHCLLAQEDHQASQLAQQLDQLNRQRRDIEQDMLQQAKSDLSEYLKRSPLAQDGEQRPAALCLYDASWHQGVIGILASRIKDKINRPVIIFAKDGDGEEPSIKGSARSVKGVHIRDVLALVDSRFPNLIEKFGGHAMAAGLSLLERDFQKFSAAFHDATLDILGNNQISDDIVTDGGLAAQDFNLHFARQLQQAGPWGQGFPEPLFDDQFRLVSQRIVAEKHLKLVLEKDQQMIDAIYFFVPENLTLQVDDLLHLVYKLDINEFRQQQNLQLIISHCL
ncbi:MAG: single-stranded-DNA-specific exonuclease RecJ [Enterobacterales bacterium]|nr:single-stranded-DNA-specific exonuclease RecJ [Enterobacterales bacterium]